MVGQMFCYLNIRVTLDVLEFGFVPEAPHKLLPSQNYSATLTTHTHTLWYQQGPDAARPILINRLVAIQQTKVGHCCSIVNNSLLHIPNKLLSLPPEPHASFCFPHLRPQSCYLADVSHYFSAILTLHCGDNRTKCRKLNNFPLMPVFPRLCKRVCSTSKSHAMNYVKSNMSIDGNMVVRIVRNFPMSAFVLKRESYNIYDSTPLLYEICSYWNFFKVWKVSIIKWADRVLPPRPA